MSFVDKNLKLLPTCFGYVHLEEMFGVFLGEESKNAAMMQKLFSSCSSTGRLRQSIQSLPDLERWAVTAMDGATVGLGRQCPLLIKIYTCIYPRTNFCNLVL